MLVQKTISESFSVQKRIIVLFVILVLTNGVVSYLQMDDLTTKKWFQFFIEIEKDSLLFLALTFTTSLTAILFKLGISLISLVYIGSVLGLSLTHRPILLQLITAEFIFTIANVLKLLLWMSFPENDLFKSDLPLFSLADVLTDDSTRYSTQHLLAQVNFFEICYWVVLTKLLADSFSLQLAKSFLVISLSIGVLNLIRIISIYSLLSGLPS